MAKVLNEIKVVGNSHHEGDTINLNADHTNIKTAHVYLNDSYSSTTDAKPGFVFNNKVLADTPGNDGKVVDFPSTSEVKITAVASSGGGPAGSIATNSFYTHPSNATINKIAHSDDGQYILVASSSDLKLSTDGGTNFGPATGTPTAVNWSSCDLLEKTPGVYVMLACTADQIWVSSDSGSTWALTDTAIEATARNFTDVAIGGYVGGEATLLLVTGARHSSNTAAHAAYYYDAGTQGGSYTGNWGNVTAPNTHPFLCCTLSRKASAQANVHWWLGSTENYAGDQSCGIYHKVGTNPVLASNEGGRFVDPSPINAGARVVHLATTDAGEELFCIIETQGNPNPGDNEIHIGYGTTDGGNALFRGNLNYLGTNIPTGAQGISTDHQGNKVFISKFNDQTIEVLDTTLLTGPWPPTTDADFQNLESRTDPTLGWVVKSGSAGTTWAGVYYTENTTPELNVFTGDSLFTTATGGAFYESGDFIQISGAVKTENNGIFVVDTATAGTPGTLSIKAAPTYSFPKTSVTANTHPSGTVARVHVSLMEMEDGKIRTSTGSSESELAASASAVQTNADAPIDIFASTDTVNTPSDFDYSAVTSANLGSTYVLHSDTKNMELKLGSAINSGTTVLFIHRQTGTNTASIKVDLGDVNGGFDGDTGLTQLTLTDNNEKLSLIYYQSADASFKTWYTK